VNFSTNSISDPGNHKIYLLELKCRRESLTKYSFNKKKVLSTCHIHLAPLDGKYTDNIFIGGGVLKKSMRFIGITSVIITSVELKC